MCNVAAGAVCVINRILTKTLISAWLRFTTGLSVCVRACVKHTRLFVCLFWPEKDLTAPFLRPDLSKVREGRRQPWGETPVSLGGSLSETRPIRDSGPSR